MQNTRVVKKTYFLAHRDISLIYQHMLEQIRPPKPLQNHLVPSGNHFCMEQARVTAFLVSHELFLYISNLILTLFDFVWVLITHTGTNKATKIIAKPFSSFWKSFWNGTGKSNSFFVSHELFLYICNLILILFKFVW